MDGPASHDDQEAARIERRGSIRRYHLIRSHNQLQGRDLPLSPSSQGRLPSLPYHVAIADRRSSRLKHKSAMKQTQTN